MDGYVISILHDKLGQREQTPTILSGRQEKGLHRGEFRNVCFPQHTDRRGEAPNLQQTRWNKTKLSGVFSIRTLNTQQSCTGWALRCLAVLTGCPPRPDRRVTESRRRREPVTRLLLTWHAASVAGTTKTVTFPAPPFLALFFFLRSQTLLIDWHGNPPWGLFQDLVSGPVF